MSDEVVKNSKIDLFISNVVDPAIGRIQEALDHGTTKPGLSQSNSPLVKKDALNVAVTSFPKASSVGGKISAAALADLFMTYAQTLTSIMRATLTLRSYTLGSQNRYSSGGAGTVTVYSNRITALNASFRMSLSEFNSAVTSGSNPFNSLDAGDPAAGAAIDTLINKLNTVLQARASQSAGTLSISSISCHSSCHGSCHGSRGRR